VQQHSCNHGAQSAHGRLARGRYDGSNFRCIAQAATGSAPCGDATALDGSVEGRRRLVHCHVVPMAWIGMAWHGMAWHGMAWV